MNRATFFAPTLLTFAFLLAACGRVERDAPASSDAPAASASSAAPGQPVAASERCAFQGAYQAISSPAGTCSAAYTKDGSSTALIPSELCEDNAVVFTAPAQPVYAALGTEIVFEPIKCGGSE